MSYTSCISLKFIIELICFGNVSDDETIFEPRRLTWWNAQESGRYPTSPTALCRAVELHKKQPPKVSTRRLSRRQKAQYFLYT